MMEEEDQRRTGQEEGESGMKRRERESRVGRERLTKVMLAVSLTSCSSVGVRS